MYNYEIYLKCCKAMDTIPMDYKRWLAIQKLKVK